MEKIMPTPKKYEWLIVEKNGNSININCVRKIMAAREAELKSKKDKSKIDIIELLTIRFLAFNNISDSLTYIL